MKQFLLAQLLKIIESLITDELVDKVKADLVKYLRDLAKETTNTLDDALVDIVAKALGVKV